MGIQTVLRKLPSFSLIVATLLVLVAPAMAQRFEGKNITSLEIRYRGAKTVDQGLLRDRISSKPGTKFRSENLDNDIASLYESGLVDDVSFLAEEVGENGVKLIAEVTTRPIRNAIGFEGNNIFSNDKLAKETGLGPGGLMSDVSILQARRNIEDYYRGHGYSYVTVDHRIEPTERDGYSNLIFIIQEGLKYEIRKIKFEGNQVFSDRDLRKEMEVKQKGIFSFLTKSGRFEPDELDADLDRVLDFYRTKGYLRVSSPGVRRVPIKGGKVDLVIEITEGQKYTVDSVGFGKMTVFKAEELYPGLSLVSGNAYNSQKMRDDIRNIRNYYGSKGYADAAVRPDIEDAGPNRVKITYRILEGDPYEVGRVNISGNYKTKDKVIRRELALQPGDMFNTVELETTKARLENMRYFSSVNVTPSPAGEGYRDIDVLVEETRTGNISAGIGFSSVDAVVGMLTLEQRNFDLFNPGNPLKNGFTGAGQTFSLNLRLGTERNEAVISFTEPWIFDRPLSMTTEAFYKDSTYFSEVYDQNNAGASISLRKRVNDKSFVRGKLTVENVDVDSSVDSTDFIDANFIGDNGANSQLSQERIGGNFARIALGLDYVYDTRDSNALPRSGQKVDLGMTFAGLGGDVETLKMEARGVSYWNMKFDSILSLKGELAFVDGNGEIPVFERLYLGGAHTLRGFEFRDVGPRDTGYTEDVYGGGSLGFLSAELTVPVLDDSLRGAVFADAGFVNEDSWDPAPDDIYADVGFGIRLTIPGTPVPLALDYAIPVSSPDSEADEGNQINFSLQTAF